MRLVTLCWLQEAEIIQTIQKIEAKTNEEESELLS